MISIDVVLEQKLFVVIIIVERIQNCAVDAFLLLQLRFYDYFFKLFALYSWDVYPTSNQVFILLLLLLKYSTE